MQFLWYYPGSWTCWFRKLFRRSLPDACTAVVPAHMERRWSVSSDLTASFVAEDDQIRSSFQSFPVSQKHLSEMVDLPGPGPEPLQQRQEFGDDAFVIPDKISTYGVDIDSNTAADDPQKWRHVWQRDYLVISSNAQWVYAKKVLEKFGAANITPNVHVTRDFPCEDPRFDVMFNTINFNKVLCDDERVAEHVMRTCRGNITIARLIYMKTTNDVDVVRALFAVFKESYNVGKLQQYIPGPEEQSAYRAPIINNVPHELANEISAENRARTSANEYVLKCGCRRRCRVRSSGRSLTRRWKRKTLFR